MANKSDGLRRLISGWRYLIPIILALGSVVYFWPFFVTSMQDRCEFGTGSTELYQRVLTEAQTYLARNEKIRLEGLNNDARVEFSTKLNSQLQEFAGNRIAFEERLAAAHALMRLYGMEFDGILPKDEKGLNNRRKESIESIYLIYLPKLNWLCLKCYFIRTGSMRLYFRNDGTGVYNKIHSYLAWAVYWPPPGQLEPFHFGRRYEVCPEFSGTGGL